jgi:hypothetical protein
LSYIIAICQIGFKFNLACQQGMLFTHTLYLAFCFFRHFSMTISYPPLFPKNSYLLLASIFLSFLLGFFGLSGLMGCDVVLCDYFFNLFFNCTLIFIFWGYLFIIFRFFIGQTRHLSSGPVLSIPVNSCQFLNSAQQTS